ncbi:MAG: PEP-CTERM sorting domain-containing protein [Kiritimatiellae bacterium]|nr:PEP-CTERM sorting domain-containing protein [Kiritimatiellia bacterium]
MDNQTKLCLFSFMLAAVSGLSPRPVHGAAVYTEDWDADAAGWSGRDGVATVSYAGGFGNPAGSMSVTFAAQGVPAPEVDALRATAASSGGAFTGDYLTDLGGFYGWTFSFYAATYLPSELQIRFAGSSGPTFLYNAWPQVGGVGGWYTINVPGTYAGNWFGGSEAAWNSALGNVSFVDIQIARSATGEEETYSVDNFQARDGGGGDPGGGGSAIPEPTTGVLMLAALAGRGLMRRRRAGARSAPAPVKARMREEWAAAN